MFEWEHWFRKQSIEASTAVPVLGTYKYSSKLFGSLTRGNILKIGFFVYEYPPAIVGWIKI